MAVIHGPARVLLITARHETVIFTTSGFICIFPIWLICKNTSGKAYLSRNGYNMAYISMLCMETGKEKKSFEVQFEKINTKL